MARRRSRAGKKIDFVRWIGSTFSKDAFSAGTAAATLFSQTLPVTIMRQRGELVIWHDGLTASPKSALIGVGLIVVPEGSGTTVTVSPITDPEADWFFYSSHVIGYEEAVTDVIDIPGLQLARERIDGKAMRRMGSTDEVQIVVENVTLLAATAVKVSAHFRTLLGS